MARTAAGSLPGRTNRKFLIVALLFGALTAVLFYALTANRTSSSNTSTASSTQVPVVVARVPIRQRTSITADMLELKNVPIDTRVAGALGGINDVVGKVTKFPIDVNQQISATAIVDTSRPSATEALAPVVPDGRRAISISASQVLTAGGLLLPGDYVDIVWECCSGGIQWEANGQPQSTSAIIFTRAIVQNVQVAAVAQSIVPSGPVGTSSDAASGSGADNPVAADTPAQVPNATTITLLVTPEQAGILMMAESTGKLRASLRNPGDTNLTQAQSETQFVSGNLIPADLMKIIQDMFAAKP
jgi:pilus assembly protein CpaB